MSEFPVPLDNLIGYVKAQHPDGGPLENVADAFAVYARLDEQSDALIGYFVDQARRSGASWSQIGSAMGVSKQAAQKRFVPSKAADLMEGNPQPFSRFTPRAARAMVAAGQLAAPEPLGASHLAAALLSEPEGLAAKAIGAAGLTPEQVYAALGTGPAPQVETPDSAGLLELSFDPSAKEVLKGALKYALRLSHNYIGTEHLLIGVLSADGSVTETFTTLGMPPERAEELLAAEIAAFQARKAG
jgi:Clp amino terminal domain, pathogenicity island component